MAKGDYVEVLVDAGGGSAKEYRIRAARAGRRVEVKTSRTAVEVNELTRNGRIVPIFLALASLKASKPSLASCCNKSRPHNNPPPGSCSGHLRSSSVNCARNRDGRSIFGCECWPRA